MCISIFVLQDTDPSEVKRFNDYMDAIYRRYLQKCNLKTFVYFIHGKFYLRRFLKSFNWFLDFLHNISDISRIFYVKKNLIF